MKIVIDAGHGFGNGNCSPDKSLYEWRWAREIASRLHAELTNRGYDVSLLTPEDNDVSLKERVVRVNKLCHIYGSGNVVLVSIHVNAKGNGSKWDSGRGFSVFVSKKASAKSKDLAEIFYRIARSRSMLGNRSIPKPDYLDRHFWTWSWTDKDIYILTQSACPAVLTENFFMDNREDCVYLLSEEGKDECVRLHADAISKYVDSL